ncbi:Glycosyl hydrolase family 43 protein [Pleurostoma richardsiae]|uniref:Glycosyl hydrolase family 43 protein n=1 Tax=Pleurostoma richardsiae TaxID=41990 RepID=A0AA38VPB1_9PEZI|nr:Glycosyl hydrolase family 43 protein [Pleurostoma richardsiae]
MISLRRLLPIGLLELLLVTRGIDAAPTDRPIFALDSRAATKSPLLSQSFPDPSIMRDTDGTWYAFATAGNGKNAQTAKAPAPGGPWTYLDEDVLPDPGSWTDGKNTWAPDVRRTTGGTYVMYYSGELANNTAHHCVGVATAKSIVGPYQPHDEPLVCHIDAGGAIDPSGFVDAATGKRYVVYKIDGNSIGHGGSCGNTKAPIVPTPIMLLELAADGTTPVGQPVQILDRTDADGPLVEAPSLVRTADGKYILFFSSHCWDTQEYDVKYAVSSDGVLGPYVRTESGSLIKTGDYGVTAPGGATSVEGGGSLVFHADCDAGRCLFETGFSVKGTNVVVS